jgi:hypothetical protein
MVWNIMGLVTNMRVKSFAAMVGVDGEVSPYGSVVFQVFADGVKIADAENLIKNAGFESGIVDWSKSGSAGVASNNVKSGRNQAWLDPGSSNTISQQVFNLILITFPIRLL